MTYQEYMGSPEWAALAKRVKERDKTCVVCNATKSLEVHHRIYDRLYHEEMSDLTTLCGKCHELYSLSGQIEPRGSDVLANVDDAIERIKSQARAAADAGDIKARNGWIEALMRAVRMRERLVDMREESTVVRS